MAKTTNNAPRTVRISLPRERKNQEDKVVWVNERRFVIKRGVEVDVPAAVAEVLRHEEDMIQESYEYEQRVAAAY